MRTITAGYCLAFTLSGCQAWTNTQLPSAHQRQQSVLSAVSRSDVADQDALLASRKDFLKAVLSTTVVSSMVSSPMMARAADDEVTLPSGVKYRVVKSGDGPKPDIGELAAIRFAAYFNEIKFDDIFETPEPYYTRVGSGGLIKGVEEVLPTMRTGDRWVLTIPGALAFGKEGRRASAGKPRIPGDATIVFDVELIAVPGKEVELIDLIGDD